MAKSQNKRQSFKRNKYSFIKNLPILLLFFSFFCAPVRSLSQTALSLDKYVGIPGVNELRVHVSLTLYFKKHKDSSFPY